MARLAIGTVVLGMGALFALGATSRAATPKRDGAALSTTKGELAHRHAALAVLAGTPSHSTSLELAMVEQRMAISALLAKRGEADAAVAHLTSALVALDSLDVADAMDRDVMLARARADAALARLAASRAQRDRAYLYVRAAFVITEELASSRPLDADVRALGEELRALQRDLDADRVASPVVRPGTTM
jgi:hypothetical protein